MQTNSNINLTSKGFLKTISIIHIALLMGLILFGVIAFIQSGKTGIDIKNVNDPFMVVVPVIAIVGFIASNLIFRQQLYNMDNDPMRDKIPAYQTALIIRYTCLEAPALVGIGSYLINGNFLFLIIAGIITLYLMSIRPTKHKIDIDLGLTEEESLEFNGGEHAS
jgi:hypothetical protein